MDRIIIAFSAVVLGIIIGVVYERNRMSRKNAMLQKQADRNLTLFRTMIQWMRCVQRGKKISEYLKEKGYYNIAIYGLGDIGERLVAELQNTEINIKYAIDINADNIFKAVPVKKPSEDLEAVNVIIVTPVFHYDEIEEMLVKKVSCPILSIDDIFLAIQDI